MAQTHRQRLGQWGEQRAAEYLINLGYVILDCNVRTPYGEIDLIARQDIQADQSSVPIVGGEPVVVFVEVKTRSSGEFGFPEQAVTGKKATHFLEAVEHYLQVNPELEAVWRVDVISVEKARQENIPIITHFENALP